MQVTPAALRNGHRVLRIKGQRKAEMLGQVEVEGTRLKEVETLPVGMLVAGILVEGVGNR